MLLGLTGGTFLKKKTDATVALAAASTAEAKPSSLSEDHIDTVEDGKTKPEWCDKTLHFDK